MLRASLVFVILGLAAIAFGINGVGGLSLEVGRPLLFISLGLSTLTFLGALLAKRGSHAPVVLTVLALVAAPTFVRAEESTGEKIEGKAEEAKTDTKKAFRKSKKKVRDATGNSSATEDAKDSLKGAGDDVGDAAKKAKNKVD